MLVSYGCVTNDPDVQQFTGANISLSPCESGTWVQRG